MSETADLAQQIGVILDAEWYLHRYPDVGTSGLSAEEHFVRFGIGKLHDPNPFFDGRWYFAQNPDVQTSGLHPLLHYLRVGAAELRDPSERFEAAWYAAEHPEAAGNPLLFHLTEGRARGFPTEPARHIPDYLPAGAPMPPAPRPDVVVDVVIPAYRGLAETRRCLSSVLADPARPPGQVIVIDDCSPEPALSAWLDRQAARRRITLIRNPRNLGFVASVNCGMQAAGRADVVLLNSDTEVPAGWLARLMAQAYAGPRIASVSPFSNNATICSYPAIEGGGRAFGLSTQALDDACRAANAGRFVEVPTTVGFCMYIRRAALDDVGLFDAETFGRGYGEENDFCLRAQAMAWRHRLACDVFVYHAGAVSFGAASPEAAHGGRLLQARYPDYAFSIAHFVRRDPIASARFALTAAIFAASALPVILLVSHGMGGGVRRHLDDLIAELQGRAHVLLLAAGGRGVDISVPALAGHPVLPLAPERDEDMVQLLRGFAVSRVHVHHVMGMEMDLRGLIHRLGVPFDVTVHDYFPLCPQVNFVPFPDAPYCGEPGPAICNACIAARPAHGARDILSWRLRHAWLIDEAARVICPSADVRDRLVRFGHTARLTVAPHEIALPAPVRPPRLGAREALRIAVLGVLSGHKGRALVLALAARAAALDVELYLIGYPEDQLPDWAARRIRVSGAYAERDLAKLLAHHRPHVVWFPASWPETYSYTLSAALAAGLPVVASRLGAMAERLAGRAATWLVEPAAGLAEWEAAFAAIAETLRGKRRAPAARPSARKTEPAAFYPDAYLAPLAGPLAKPTVQPALRDLRRRGRTSVVLVAETFEDGAITPCGHIRLLLPLQHAAERAPIDLVLASPAEALRYRAHVLATQRYAPGDAATARALMGHARDTGTALLYDLDDDLLNIPRGHADAAALRPLAPLVRAMLGGADAIWTSTAVLAGALAGADRAKPAVLANALDERLWPAAPPIPPVPGAPVRLVMMGTHTHDADMAVVMPALERLVALFGDRVGIDVIGMTGAADLPPYLNRLGVPPLAGASYPGFVSWFGQARRGMGGGTDPGIWQIGLVPLAETAFNQGKSAIKTLDFAALGLALLASDVPAYRGSLADGPGGALVANTTDAWFAALVEFVRNDASRGAARKAAQAGFARHTLAAMLPARLKALQTVARKAR